LFLKEYFFRDFPGSAMYPLVANMGVPVPDFIDGLVIISVSKAFQEIVLYVFNARFNFPFILSAPDTGCDGCTVVMRKEPAVLLLEYRLVKVGFQNGCLQVINFNRFGHTSKKLK